MPARSLMVGLDGADLDVIEAFGAERLPTLHRLLRQGVHARARTVLPTATLPNWATLLTGAGPGRHGVFDFAVRTGYRVRFEAGRAREMPLWVERLDAAGLKCACVGFPGTWPAPQLRYGIFVSGWDSPVAYAADRSFVWPRSLHAEMLERFGPLVFGELDEMRADRGGWLDALADKLRERVARRAELGRWLLGRCPWDVFVLYFGEADTASHYLWATHDGESPRRTRGIASDNGVRVVYEALDHAVAELIDAAGADVELTIVSDHGSGGTSDKVLYLNRVLEQAGLLRFRPRSFGHAGGAAWRSRLPSLLSARARHWLFEAGRRALPNHLESRIRFGAIDMHRTALFSDELNYFPAVHINLRGREPRGTVAPEERERMHGVLSDVLGALKDPWTGKSVVRAVHAREDIYDGPFVGRAPDFVLELELDGNYSYNLLASSEAPRGTGSWRRLVGEELRPAKGRSLCGSHRDRGLWIATGPSVAPRGLTEADVADVPATLLGRLVVEVPSEFSGRVHWEALRNPVTRGASPLPATLGRVRARDAGSERIVVDRLRALGYLE